MARVRGYLGGERGSLQGYLTHKKHPLPRPYSRTPPRVLWWSYGGGMFLMKEVPLYHLGRDAIGDIAVEGVEPCLPDQRLRFCGGSDFLKIINEYTMSMREILSSTGVEDCANPFSPQRLVLSGAIAWTPLGSPASTCSGTRPSPRCRSGRRCSACGCWCARSSWRVPSRAPSLSPAALTTRRVSWATTCHHQSRVSP